MKRLIAVIMCAFLLAGCGTSQPIVPHTEAETQAVTEASYLYETLDSLSYEIDSRWETTRTATSNQHTLGSSSIFVSRAICESGRFEHFWKSWYEEWRDSPDVANILDESFDSDFLFLVYEKSDGNSEEIVSFAVRESEEIYKIYYIVYTAEAEAFAGEGMDTFVYLVDSLYVPEAETEPATSVFSNAPKAPSVTKGEENALAEAKRYLDVMPFSKTGLAEQLEYEGYTPDEAAYAVENCGADWYKQAEISAQEYLDSSPFSRQGLIEQLIYEGFTDEEAEHGVNAVYD